MLQEIAMSFRRILITVDGGPLAAHAAELGIELALSLGAEIAFAIDPVLSQAPGIAPGDFNQDSAGTASGRHRDWQPRTPWHPVGVVGQRRRGSDAASTLQTVSKPAAQTTRTERRQTDCADAVHQTAISF
jgi:nucleotide-binding universal stress UspA family protein